MANRALANRLEARFVIGKGYGSPHSLEILKATILMSDCPIVKDYGPVVKSYCPIVKDYAQDVASYRRP